MKNNKFTDTLVILIMVGCNTSRQGIVVQGRDGKIENAKIVAKCTPPQKSYAKELS